MEVRMSNVEREQPRTELPFLKNVENIQTNRMPYTHREEVFGNRQRSYGARKYIQWKNHISFSVLSVWDHAAMFLILYWHYATDLEYITDVK